MSAAGILVGIPGARLGLEALSGFAGPHTPATVSANGVETTESAKSMLDFKARSFRMRPQPSPSSSTTPAAYEGAAAPSGTMSEIIYAAAAESGLSGDYLIGVAICESHLSPTAYNPAGYYGLFQFDQTTWAEFGYGSIYDPVAQARTAARLLAAGEYRRWPNCS